MQPGAGKTSLSGWATAGRGPGRRRAWPGHGAWSGRGRGRSEGRGWRRGRGATTARASGSGGRAMWLLGPLCLLLSSRAAGESGARGPGARAWVCEGPGPTRAAGRRGPRGGATTGRAQRYCVDERAGCVVACARAGLCVQPRLGVARVRPRVCCVCWGAEEGRAELFLDPFFPDALRHGSFPVTGVRLLPQFPHLYSAQEQVASCFLPFLLRAARFGRTETNRAGPVNSFCPPRRSCEQNLYLNRLPRAP